MSFKLGYKLKRQTRDFRFQSFYDLNHLNTIYITLCTVSHTGFRIVSMYHVKIWNGEDGYYVAQCQELPAAITQGKTKEEVIENITEAIQLVLEDMQTELREKKTELIAVEA